MRTYIVVHTKLVTLDEKVVELFRRRRASGDFELVHGLVYLPDQSAEIANERIVTNLLERYFPKMGKVVNDSFTQQSLLAARKGRHEQSQVLLEGVEKFVAEFYPQISHLLTNPLTYFEQIPDVLDLGLDFTKGPFVEGTLGKLYFRDKHGMLINEKGRILRDSKKRAITYERGSFLWMTNLPDFVRQGIIYPKLSDELVTFDLLDRNPQVRTKRKVILYDTEGYRLLKEAGVIFLNEKVQHTMANPESTAKKDTLKNSFQAYWIDPVTQIPVPLFEGWESVKGDKSGLNSVYKHGMKAKKKADTDYENKKYHAKRLLAGFIDEFSDKILESGHGPNVVRIIVQEDTHRTFFYGPGSLFLGVSDVMYTDKAEIDGPRNYRVEFNTTDRNIFEVINLLHEERSSSQESATNYLMNEIAIQLGLKSREKLKATRQMTKAERRRKDNIDSDINKRVMNYLRNVLDFSQVGSKLQDQYALAKPSYFEGGFKGMNGHAIQNLEYLTSWLHQLEYFQNAVVDDKPIALALRGMYELKVFEHIGNGFDRDLDFFKVCMASSREIYR